MFVILISLHILVCIWLIVIVLLQAGKGSGLSGLFGGGSAPEAIFGGGGDSTLKKITTLSAVLFLITSTLLYVYVARQGSTSVVRPIAAPTAPATPAEAPAAPGQSKPAAPAQSSQAPAPVKPVAVKPVPVKSAPAGTTPAQPAAAPVQPTTPTGK